MRNLLFYCLLFTSLSVCAQYGSNSPSDYFMKVTTDNNLIIKDALEYSKQVAKNRNATKTDKRRKELVATLKSALAKLSKISTFQGSNDLRQAYIDFITINYRTLKEDFERIVDMEKIAEDSYDEMEAYLLFQSRLNRKLDSAFQDLKIAEKQFADEHNLTFSGNESKTAKKLGNFNDLFEYRNKLFLIYFKSSFYDDQMHTALAEGKIGEVEQFRQTLDIVSEEGIERAKEVGDYKGYNNLKYSVIQVLQSYKTQTAKYIPSQIDYFITKGEFETIDKNMKAKNQKKLTRDEVNSFNKSVADLNEAVAKFNSNNEILNKLRNAQAERVNKATNDFYKRFR